MGFIALYVTVCMNLNRPGSCVTEYITDSMQNDLNMTSCMGIEGLKSAQDFIEKHPLYHSWHIKGWSCQIGNRKAPDKGAA
jgi:hypothetical protein